MPGVPGVPGVPGAPGVPARAGRRPPALPAALPAYALYGEPQRAAADASGPGLAEGLHLETIAHRSRVHDWEIRPHRHASLFQILVIAQGAVQARLDADEQPLHGPCVLTVPPLAVHGFRFAPDIDGMVITLDQRLLAALLGEDRAWQQALLALRALAPVPAAVLQAAATLRDDYGSSSPWRAAALDTALRRLLLEVARTAPPPPQPADGPAPRALLHTRRYQALVDRHFRRQPRLADLAAQLGITPTQLNRVCHQVLGHSALAVLHGRLLLEARRELAYTGMSIKQVAMGLGFADAGYFTRFFQRLAGCTPTAWRQQHGPATHNAPP